MAFTLHLPDLMTAKHALLPLLLFFALPLLPIHAMTRPEPRPNDVDFVPDQKALQKSVYLDKLNFSSASCEVQEGCVAGPGKRDLLRFDANSLNLGTQDFVLGDPTSPSNADKFVWSPCHGHYHVRDWALYELLDTQGQVVISGRKQAFCVRDDFREYGSKSKQFSCDFQGLTGGWADSYPASLSCQWLDITGVPAGKYRLRITLNPERRFSEANYDNNTAETSVTIP